MLNEDSDIQSVEVKSKIKSMKTNSVVTECPSVSTIVSLSEIVGKLNTITNVTPSQLNKKEVILKKNEIKGSDGFIYKKSTLELNNKYNKGFCIKKRFSSVSFNKPVENINKKCCSLEDYETFVLYEEKLNYLHQSIKEKDILSNGCSELWDLYINRNLFDKIERYLHFSKIKANANQISKLELITLMICYGLENNLNDNIRNKLYKLISQHYQAMLTILECILDNISNSTHYLGLHLRKIIDTNRLGIKKENNGINLVNYSSLIDDYLKSIEFDLLCIISDQIEYICIRKRKAFSRMFSTVQNISSYSITDIERMFNISFINDVDDEDVDEEEDNNEIQKISYIPIPFLKRESLKDYTLVLDLYNTLIHFNKDETNKNTKGNIRFRPGLHEFLIHCNLYYELVIFTTSLKEDADPILDEIEQNTIYFDYRLYREHTQIINNYYVKDLNSLGRNLSRTLIIDHRPQSYSLQKKNGIFIKAFKGDDKGDSALIDLIPILKTIASKEMDVREGLLLFKNDITTKISSNFYRNQLKN